MKRLMLNQLFYTLGLNANSRMFVAIFRKRMRLNYVMILNCSLKLRTEMHMKWFFFLFILITCIVFLNRWSIWIIVISRSGYYWFSHFMDLKALWVQDDHFVQFLRKQCSPLSRIGISSVYLACIVTSKRTPLNRTCLFLRLYCILLFYSYIDGPVCLSDINVTPIL